MLTFRIVTMEHPTLSSEAKVYRLLLRAQIVRHLQQRERHVPASMLERQPPRAPPPPLCTYQLVWYAELEHVFSRIVLEFEDLYGDHIASLFTGWPSTKSALRMFVTGVMENSLRCRRAEWGCMIAISIFLIHVAIRCSDQDMEEQIAPIIDYSAQLADENLMAFVRAHGGWSAFTLAFRAENRQATPRPPSGLLVAQTIMAAACAIL